MRRESIFSLIILSIILSPSYIHTLYSTPLDYRGRDIFLGINSSSIVPRISIIYKNGEGYLMLNPKLLYPVKDLPEKSYLGKRISLISPDLLKNFTLRFIVEYKDQYTKDELIHIVPKMGGKVLYIFKYLPFISIQLPLQNASLPLSLGLNINMMVDYKVKTFLNESVPIIKDPVLWSKLENEYGYKINGTGVVIAILDTGIDGSHPDFYFPNGTCKIIVNMSVVPGEDAKDRFGHGTHVAGIAAGLGTASGGKYVGVAPGAWLANIKVLSDNGTGYTSWIIKGIEEAIDERVDVINLSLGGGGNGDGSDPLSMAVDVAVDKGVVVVVAAGNEGPEYSTLGSPAVAKKAITVGAITKSYKIAKFSSRGPTGDGRIKPEVVAPGVNIVAPIARDSLLAKEYSDNLIHGSGGDYLSLSGTSMAAPHVAGLAALVIQAHPKWNASEVRNAIISSAISLGYDEFTEGAGLVDAYHAVKRDIQLSLSSFSIILRKTSIYPYRFNISLTSIVNETRKINNVTISTMDFYNNSVNINDAISIEYPETLSPYQATNLIFSVDHDIPFSIYEGKLTIELSDGGRYKILFSILKVIVFEVNATFEKNYFDTLFFMYNKKDPSRWILPTGFKSSYENDTKNYRYTEWFYLYPGDYILYGLSMNSWMGGETIPGVVFIYGDELAIRDNLFMSIEYTHTLPAKIPRNYDGNIFNPICQIYGFYTPYNKSLIIYQFGVWNLSSPYKLYSSIRISNPIYLNLQYVNVPKVINETDGISWIDYIDSFLTSSWVINQTLSSLSFNNLYGYTLNTASIRPDSVAIGGIAIFPPKQNYTYLMLSPLYQGLNYTVYSDDIKYLYQNKKMREFRLFIGLDKNKRDSFISFVDPSYTGREIESLKPSYTMFTRVEKGTNNSPYLNITMFLTSSMNPPQFPGGYDYKYNITINGILENSSRGSGEILIDLPYYKYIDGVYRIQVIGQSRNPLYSKIYSMIQFKSFMDDVEPPLIYHIDLEPIINGSQISGYITIMERSGLKNLSVSGIWNNIIQAQASVKQIGMGVTGGYVYYIYKFTFLVLGDSLDLDVNVVDNNGNIRRDYYEKVALKNILYPELRFNVSITPRYIEPDGNSTLMIKSSDNGLYGFKILLNGTYIGYLRTHTDEYRGNLTINLKDYGLYKIKMISSPFYYHSPYVLNESIISTILRVEPYAQPSTRVTVGVPARIGVHVMYEYHHLPASGIVVIINGTKYVTDKDGYVIFNYVRNKVCKIFFIVNNVYGENELTNIHTYEAPTNVISMIFDKVYISTLNESKRVDVGSEVKYKFIASYMYDNSPFIGDITFDINDTIYTIPPSNNGVYELSLSKNIIGRFAIKIESIKDLRYNVTAFTTNFTTLYVIYDKVVIRLHTDSPSIVGLGTLVNITYNAFYAYDHKSFEGILYIEPYPYTSHEPGLKVFRVIKILDYKYGLTVFDSNEIKIFFDTINVTINKIYGLGSYNYIINVKYYSTGKPASGTIEINGVRYNITGRLVFNVDSILPYNKLDIKIDITGFKEFRKTIVDYNYINISIYVVIILAIILSIYLITRRRR